MALDRFFILKCVVLFYAYIAAVLGVLIILGSVYVLANGQLTAGLQSMFSAIFFMAWAFLGYSGATKKNRCQLLAFATFLTVSFILSLIILASLPSEYGDPSGTFQEVIMERLNIHDNYKLKIVKILIGVESIWKIFTGVCAFWLSHLIRLEQRNDFSQYLKG